MPGKMIRASAGFILFLGVGLIATPHLPLFLGAAMFVTLFVVYLYVSGSASAITGMAKHAPYE